MSLDTGIAVSKTDFVIEKFHRNNIADSNLKPLRPTRELATWTI